MSPCYQIASFFVYGSASSKKSLMGFEQLVNAARLLAKFHAGTKEPLSDLGHLSSNINKFVLD